MRNLSKSVLAVLRWEPSLGAHRGEGEEAEGPRIVVQWANLLRIRFWFFAFFFGFLAGFGLGEWAIWPGFFAGAAWQLVYGRAMGCPMCGKAIKTSAVRCRHCGHEPEYTQ